MATHYFRSHDRTLKERPGIRAKDDEVSLTFGDSKHEPFCIIL